MREVLSITNNRNYNELFFPVVLVFSALYLT